MPGPGASKKYRSAREKFLGLSLESTRKSYYPQLREQLDLIRENERRLRLLADNLPARISYVDADERYAFVNLAYEKAFGLKRDRIIGRRVASILGRANYQKAAPHIRAALHGKKTRFEAEFTEPDGRTGWFEIHYVPDVDPKRGVTGFYDLTLDLTEKKRAEQENAQLQARLQQAQKMEAVGTLAGGVAHDFNNLLMGVQGRASLMALKLDPSHPCMSHIRAIEEYVKSAADLTRQLLGFARGGKYEVKPIDINDVLRNSADLFGRTKKEIRIRADLHDAPLIVEADRRQIEQVLLNMFVNAWQAMPDGGEIFLETAPAVLDPAYCAPHEIQPGPYARASVTDTGVGMDEATLRRVFDPFFTTREKARGTGLGMASAYGIIKNHGGVITVYSEPGHGAAFNIYLPLSPKTQHQDKSVDEKLITGHETILLTDDETLILDVGEAMLEELGYRVVTARSGEEALDVIAAGDEDVDLVILDMIMPGLDGGKTFDRIREMRPDLKVLLSSGYALRGQAEEIMKRGCDGFIQKPFNIKEFSEKIRGMLDDAEAGREE